MLSIKLKDYGYGKHLVKAQKLLKKAVRSSAWVFSDVAFMGS